MENVQEGHREYTGVIRGKWNGWKLSGHGLEHSHGHDRGGEHSLNHYRVPARGGADHAISAHERGISTV